MLKISKFAIPFNDKECGFNLNQENTICAKYSEKRLYWALVGTPAILLVLVAHRLHFISACSEHYHRIHKAILNRNKMR